MRILVGNAIAWWRSAKNRKKVDNHALQASFVMSRAAGLLKLENEGNQKNENNGLLKYLRIEMVVYWYQAVWPFSQEGCIWPEPLERSKAVKKERWSNERQTVAVWLDLPAELAKMTAHLLFSSYLKRLLISLIGRVSWRGSEFASRKAILNWHSGRLRCVGKRACDGCLPRQGRRLSETGNESPDALSANPMCSGICLWYIWLLAVSPWFARKRQLVK